MNSSSRPFRFISGFLSLVLFITNCAFAHQIEIGFWPQHALPKTIVHIQDIHMNSEAQADIAVALQRLINENKVDLVALEGAFAPIDLDRFRAFPQRGVVRKVADYLLRENKISGPIHTALISPKEMPPIVGVDDEFHYQANVAAYRASSRLMKKYKKESAKSASALAARKSAAFNPVLAAFDQKIEAYRRGALKMGDYAALVSGYQRPAPANVARFLEARRMESTLDFARVEAERARLLSRLMAKMAPDQTADLINHSVAYRRGALSHPDFYRYLNGLCAQRGVPLSAFPAMKNYCAYVLLSASIDADGLFQELKACEKSGYAALVGQPEEKQLVEESARLNLVRKLLDFSLTKDEWEEYRSSRIIAEPSLDLTSFESFYSEADLRDAAMAENLLRAMDKAGASRAVLVTGGFHSKGINRRAREAGIATIPYTPKITHLRQGYGGQAQENYLSVFAQEKTPLETLFQGQKLFLAFPPAAGTVLEAPVAIATMADAPPEQTLQALAPALNLQAERESPSSIIVTEPVTRQRARISIGDTIAGIRVSQELLDISNVEWFWKLSAELRNQLLRGVEGQMGFRFPGLRYDAQAEAGLLGFAKAWPFFVWLDPLAVDWHVQRGDFFSHFLGHEFSETAAAWAGDFRRAVQRIGWMNFNDKDKNTFLAAFITYLAAADTGAPFTLQESENLMRYCAYAVEIGTSFAWPSHEYRDFVLFDLIFAFRRNWPQIGNILTDPVLFKRRVKSLGSFIHALRKIEMSMQIYASLMSTPDNPGLHLKTHEIIDDSYSYAHQKDYLGAFARALPFLSTVERMDNFVRQFRALSVSKEFLEYLGVATEDSYVRRHDMRDETDAAVDSLIERGILSELEALFFDLIARKTIENKIRARVRQLRELLEKKLLEPADLPVLIQLIAGNYRAYQIEFIDMLYHGRFTRGDLPLLIELQSRIRQQTPWFPWDHILFKILVVFQSKAMVGRDLRYLAELVMQPDSFQKSIHPALDMLKRGDILGQDLPKLLPLAAVDLSRVDLLQRAFQAGLMDRTTLDDFHLFFSLWEKIKDFEKGLMASLKISIGANAFLRWMFMGEPRTSVEDARSWYVHLSRRERLDRMLRLPSVGLEGHLVVKDILQFNELRTTAETMNRVSEEEGLHWESVIMMDDFQADVRIKPAYPSTFSFPLRALLQTPAFRRYETIGAHYTFGMDMGGALAIVALACFYADLHPWVPRPRGKADAGHPGVYSYRGITLQPITGELMQDWIQSNIHLRPILVLLAVNDFEAVSYELFTQDLEILSWFAGAIQSGWQAFRDFKGYWNQWLSDLGGPAFLLLVDEAVKRTLEKAPGASVNDVLDLASLAIFTVLYGVSPLDVAQRETQQVTEEENARALPHKAALAAHISEFLLDAQNESVPVPDVRSALNAYRRAQTLPEMEQARLDAILVLEHYIDLGMPIDDSIRERLLDFRSILKPEEPYRALGVIAEPDAIIDEAYIQSAPEREALWITRRVVALGGFVFLAGLAVAWTVPGSVPAYAGIVVGAVLLFGAFAAHHWFIDQHRKHGLVFKWPEDSNEAAWDGISFAPAFGGEETIYRRQFLPGEPDYVLVRPDSNESAPLDLFGLRVITVHPDFFPWLVADIAALSSRANLRPALVFSLVAGFIAAGTFAGCQLGAPILSSATGIILFCAAVRALWIWSASTHRTLSEDRERKWRALGVVPSDASDSIFDVPAQDERYFAHAHSIYWYKLTDETRYKLARYAMQRLFAEVSRLQPEVRHLKQMQVARDLDDQTFTIRLRFASSGRSEVRKLALRGYINWYFSNHENDGRNTVHQVLESLDLVPRAPRPEDIASLAHLAERIHAYDFDSIKGPVIPWERLQPHVIGEAFDEVAGVKGAKNVLELTTRNLKGITVPTLGISLTGFMKDIDRRVREENLPITPRWLAFQKAGRLPSWLATKSLNEQDLDTLDDLKALLDHGILLKIPWELLLVHNKPMVIMLLKALVATLNGAQTFEQVKKLMGRLTFHDVALLFDRDLKRKVPGFQVSFVRFVHNFRNPPGGSRLLLRGLRFLGVVPEAKISQEQMYTLAELVAALEITALRPGTVHMWEKFQKPAHRALMFLLAREKEVPGPMAIDEMSALDFRRRLEIWNGQSLAGLLRHYGDRLEDLFDGSGFLRNAAVLRAALDALAGAWDLLEDERSNQSFFQNELSFYKRLMQLGDSEYVNTNQIRALLANALRRARTAELNAETKLLKRQIGKWILGLEAYFAILDSAEGMPESFGRLLLSVEASGRNVREELVNRATWSLRTVVHHAALLAPATDPDVILKLVAAYRAGLKGKHDPLLELRDIAFRNPTGFIKTMKSLARTRSADMEWFQDSPGGKTFFRGLKKPGQSDGFARAALGVVVEPGAEVDAAYVQSAPGRESGWFIWRVAPSAGKAFVAVVTCCAFAPPALAVFGALLVGLIVWKRADEAHRWFVSRHGKHGFVKKEGDAYVVVHPDPAEKERFLNTISLGSERFNLRPARIFSVAATFLTLGTIIGIQSGWPVLSILGGVSLFILGAAATRWWSAISHRKWNKTQEENDDVLGVVLEIKSLKLPEQHLASLVKLGPEATLADVKKYFEGISLTLKKQKLNINQLSKQYEVIAQAIRKFYVDQKNSEPDASRIPHLEGNPTDAFMSAVKKFKGLAKDNPTNWGSYVVTQRTRINRMLGLDDVFQDEALVTERDRKEIPADVKLVTKAERLERLKALAREKPSAKKVLFRSPSDGEPLLEAVLAFKHVTLADINRDDLRSAATKLRAGLAELGLEPGKIDSLIKERVTFQTVDVTGGALKFAARLHELAKKFAKDKDKDQRHLNAVASEIREIVIALAASAPWDGQIAGGPFDYVVCNLQYAEAIELFLTLVKEEITAKVFRDFKLSEENIREFNESLKVVLSIVASPVLATQIFHAHGLLVSGGRGFFSEYLRVVSLDGGFNEINSYQSNGTDQAMRCQLESLFQLQALDVFRWTNKLPARGEKGQAIYVQTWELKRETVDSHLSWLQARLNALGVFELVPFIDSELLSTWEDLCARDMLQASFGPEAMLLPEAIFEFFQRPDILSALDVDRQNDAPMYLALAVREGTQRPREKYELPFDSLIAERYHELKAHQAELVGLFQSLHLEYKPGVLNELIFDAFLGAVIVAREANKDIDILAFARRMRDALAKLLTERSHPKEEHVMAVFERVVSGATAEVDDNFKNHLSDRAVVLFRDPLFADMRAALENMMVAALGHAGAAEHVRTLVDGFVDLAGLPPLSVVAVIERFTEFIAGHPHLPPEGLLVLQAAYADAVKKNPKDFIDALDRADSLYPVRLSPEAARDAARALVSSLAGPAVNLHVGERFLEPGVALEQAANHFGEEAVQAAISGQMLEQNPPRLSVSAALGIFERLLPASDGDKPGRQAKKMPVTLVELEAADLPALPSLFALHRDEKGNAVGRVVAVVSDVKLGNKVRQYAHGVRVDIELRRDKKTDNCLHVAALNKIYLAWLAAHDQKPDDVILYLAKREGMAVDFNGAKGTSLEEARVIILKAMRSEAILLLKRLKDLESIGKVAKFVANQA